MRQPRALFTLAILTLSLANAAGAGEMALDGKTFTLPDGFRVERVAGPPLVDRPIVADFDERGRLYVADSSGSNDKVEKQLAEKPHRVVRLEDTDGDGTYDRRTVFADRLMFPEGAMWFDGSLYVSAPPSIWKLTDTDDDGIADRREEWFKGGTLTGCANDLHGPYLGPDGWIYWCKGAFAKQTYERPDRPPFVTNAAHIFRRRPEGGPVEPVMTGGMDNPVEVVFTPGGERIVSSTFLQHPGGGKRDGLIHVLYGGVYGKVHDVIEAHPRTGPDVLPAMAHLGAAAPCGLARVESEALGGGYRDSLLAANFNLQKVSRHVLEAEGASFKSRDEDFLACSDKDFHPTDVLEDADGSILVLDTGGWYKLCCPTSQIVKPDVLGAIYRVTRKGAPRVDDPRGLRLAWSKMTPEALAHLLANPRPAVRRRAIQALANLGETALPAIAATLRQAVSPEARRNAVWAATRIEGPKAREAARLALSDADQTTRQAAIHSASVRRDAKALPTLLGLLKSPSAQNRRAAAEAIGRIGDKAAVPALLDAISGGDPHDWALAHSLIHALIEVGDPEATAKGLARGDADSRRGALIALDQMGGGKVGAEVVAPSLKSPDTATREAASWIIGRHPEWGNALAGNLRERLDAKAFSTAEKAELEAQLARFAGSDPVRDLLAERLGDASAPVEARRIAMAGMARAGLQKAPEGWIDALAGILNGGDDPLTRQAVATARALPAPEGEAAKRLADALNNVASGPGCPEDLRLEALAAVPGGLTEVGPGTFAFLREQLNPDRPAAARTLAADVLAHSTLDIPQLSALTRSVAEAGPLELGRLLAAFDRSDDEGVGLKLVDALGRSASARSLRRGAIEPHLAKFGGPVRERAEALYADLDAGSGAQRARLDALAAAMPEGDIRRGQAVFNGAKAACASCHAIGYLGGVVGPDLTGIGTVRTPRDLLEAVVYPSASFVRSFEPTLVATVDGKVHNGILKKDGEDEVILATGPVEVVRIPRGQVEEMRPGNVSVMPEGLDKQLSAQELADLLAFLQSRR